MTTQPSRTPLGFTADQLAAAWTYTPKDPLLWAGTRFPNRFLWSKQREILASVRDNRRTAVQACHGPGKSYIAALVASWWIDAYPPGEALVVSTAPTAAQVGAILWHEIRRAHREGGLPGRIGLDNVWRVGDVMVGVGRKPADHDEHGFQGLHRRRVLVIADEACGITQQLWTAFESVTTNDECRILAIGNPDDPASEFANVCKPGSGWNVLRVSAFDTPNLTGETVPDDLRKLLVSADWVEDKKKRWGESSPRYQSKVLGLFPEVSEDTLISPRLIADAQERTLEAGSPVTVSVDVARYGSDYTVIGVAAGSVFRVAASLPSTSTTETTGRTLMTARDHPDSVIVVDGAGVGGGVVDGLRETLREDRTSRIRVIDFQAGARARDPEQFANARSEAWWGLRTRFADGDIDIDPDDDELAAQLGSLRYRINSRGQIQVESKDEMAKRGLPSPDRGDCLMQAYARSGTGVVQRVNTNMFTRKIG